MTYLIFIVGIEARNICSFSRYLFNLTITFMAVLEQWKKLVFHLKLKIYPRAIMLVLHLMLSVLKM